MDSERNRPVGYAVIGLGWISQAAMIPAFANARDSSRLVALVSGDGEKRRRVAQVHGLDPEKDTYSYDELETCLARDDVEAVYIAVPNHLHREYTERAAARGVHVLCEKPMAVTEEECTAMIDACRAADVRLMIAYRLHFDPLHMEAVRRMEAGSIDRGRVFSSTFTQQVADGDIRLVPPGKGGGPLYDLGIYCLNAARYLFRAEPECVWATRASRPQDRFDDAAEMITCVLRFPGERLATFTCSFGARAVAVLHVAGDDGEIRMDNAYNFVGDRRMEQRGGADAGVRTANEHDQFGPQLRYFSHCIRTGTAPEPDGGEGRVDVRIIRAVYESLASGRPVDVDVQADRRPGPELADARPALEEPELVGVSDPSG